MALGSTQSLTEMNTRSISWGQMRPVRKADNLPPSCAVVTKSGNLNFLEPSGPLQACNGTDLPFTPNFIFVKIVQTISREKEVNSEFQNQNKNSLENRLSIFSTNTISTQQTICTVSVDVF